MGLLVGTQKLRKAWPSGIPWRALERTGLPEAGQSHDGSKSSLLCLEEWGLMGLPPGVCTGLETVPLRVNEVETSRKFSLFPP